MNTGRVAKLGTLAVLAVSGTYFFVYLWRWEMNRAVLAGVVFVAAEIGLALAVVLDRLRRLEERVDQPRSGSAPARVAMRVHEAAAPPRDRFEWLNPRDGRMGVFVPLLMGMGVVASGLAWVVERLARVTAGPVLERRLVAKLAPISWPSGGLATDADVRWADITPTEGTWPAEGGSEPPAARRRFGPVKVAVGVLLAAAALVGGVDMLGDRTQDRPDRVVPGSRSEIILTLSMRSPRDASQAGNAQRLWTVCEGMIPNEVVPPGVVAIGDGRFRVVTQPAVGHHAWRRLQGCLEDLTLDRVGAAVVSKHDILP